jgi:general secretion pathway protein M
LGASVTTLRVQAALLEQQAIEYGRLRAAPAATASPTDLRTLVQTRVGDAGLSRALVRIDVMDASQVKVVFGALPFADWLAWVASLQAQQVRLDASRIEALSAPGLVSVTATFTRPTP